VKPISNFTIGYSQNLKSVEGFASPKHIEEGEGCYWKGWTYDEKRD
jgi:hypothetical protein